MLQLKWSNYQIYSTIYLPYKSYQRMCRVAVEKFCPLSVLIQVLVCERVLTKIFPLSFPQVYLLQDVAYRSHSAVILSSRTVRWTSWLGNKSWNHWKFQNFLYKKSINTIPFFSTSLLFTESVYTVHVFFSWIHQLNCNLSCCRFAIEDSDRVAVDI